MTTHIDAAALRSIASLQRPGKPDLVGKVIHLFQVESPKALAAIEQGLDSGDLSAVRNAAHALKSSSAYVGAKVLSERCRDLEAAALDANYAACIAMGDGLDDMFGEISLELDAFQVKAA